MRTTEIAPSIYRLEMPIPDNPLGHVNCYLIKGIAGWMIVDTGYYTPDALRHLKQELRALGLRLEDVHSVVVTHIHPDHFGLAGRIKQLSPRTRLLMHRYESDLIDSRYMKVVELQDKTATLLGRHGAPEHDIDVLSNASMPALEFVTITLPDDVLYGGEILPTGVYDLEVIWTPGHSPGHVCLYEPRNRLLFTGDHILATISPNVAYHVQSGDNPLGDYLSSLRKLEKLPVAKVLPAHEQEFTDLPGRIRELLDHHETRKGEILRLIAKEPKSACQLAREITWSIPGPWDNFPPLHRRAAMVEAIAHLECMRWEGRVQRMTDASSVLYALP